MKWNLRLKIRDEFKTANPVNPVNVRTILYTTCNDNYYYTNYLFFIDIKCSEINEIVVTAISSGTQSCILSAFFQPLFEVSVVMIATDCNRKLLFYYCNVISSISELKAIKVSKQPDTIYLMKNPKLGLHSAFHRNKRVIAPQRFRFLVQF